MGPPTLGCLCVPGQTDNEEDILHHLVNNHLSDLTTLPISTIKQGRSVLLPALQSLAADIEEQSDDYSLHFPAASSRKTSPQSSSSELTPPLLTPPIIEDEEVPPLPPPSELPGMGHSLREDVGRQPLPDSPTPFSSSPMSDTHDEMPGIMYSPIPNIPLPPPTSEPQTPAGTDKAGTTRSLQKK